MLTLALLGVPSLVSRRVASITLKAADLTPSLTSTSTTGLANWPSTFDNSLLRDLRAETPELSPHESREVKGAHYTRLRPTVTAPAPSLVGYSAAVAESLGLNAEDCESDEFLRFFTGSPPSEVDCWATVYGASFTGRYGGQRGDGRAISVGQVNGREIQLKGAGITPYSRRSDGRAVLRSSVREFLAQELMAALGVPTTRSLCIAITGERVQRYWYTDEGAQRVMFEPGAVGTRVATSFIRFGQREIFAQRGELDLLQELVEHALVREFPHLLTAETAEIAAKLQTAESVESVESVESDSAAAEEDARTQLDVQLLLRMFDGICQRQALLIAEWMRVGYCQGNMNSDNAAIGGVTLDYGPFAFMERFEPYYNPWTGGGQPYSYGMQANAASTNLVGLGNAFAALAMRLSQQEKESGGSGGRGGGIDPEEIIAELTSSVRSGFGSTFRSRHSELCRQKLGLAEWDDEAQKLWDWLLRLMSSRAGHGRDEKRQSKTNDESDGATSTEPRASNLAERLVPSSWRQRWDKRGDADGEREQDVEEPEGTEEAVSPGVDFTLFFRTLGTPELTKLAVATASAPANEAGDADEAAAAHDSWLSALLGPAALDSIETWPEEHRTEWRAWGAQYWARVAAEARGDERLAEMAAANPKYILRSAYDRYVHIHRCLPRPLAARTLHTPTPPSHCHHLSLCSALVCRLIAHLPPCPPTADWMAAQAYDAAALGDFSVVRELQEVLSRPYDEQGAEVDSRWAQVTPVEARDKMGLTYMT